MASAGTTCPCCGRAVSLTKTRTLFRHMPYESRADADMFDVGRRCLGSGKTPDEAKRAADERTERRRAWRESLRTGNAAGGGNG